MPALSATLITHNESANIARAIRSLSCADEIVVIDSDSTDGTPRSPRDWARASSPMPSKALPRKKISPRHRRSTIGC